MNNVYRTIADFDKKLKSYETAPKFMSLLKSKWDEIHKKPNVFRYKIDNLKERIVDEKYLVLLNPNRASNRRAPEHISSMSQPFTEEKFNFTKVSREEVMFSIGESADNPDLHSFIVNVSPITRYHTLFCPFINKKLPQVITQESLHAAIQVMFVANDSNLKMGYNSLCGLASVNHLHFHLFVEGHVLPVEKAEWKLLLENLSYLEDYLVPACCFDLHENSSEYELKEVYRLIKYLQDESIAHNIFIKMRATLDIVEVYVFPRKNTTGAKQPSAFNVAVLELSGCFPVFSKDAYNNLKTEDLENEIKKWKYHDFDKLLKKLPRLLYARDLQTE